MSRHDLYGTERYSFVIWWTCVIDTHALLTGGGNGNYVETLLKKNMLPVLNNPLRPSGALGRDSSLLNDIENHPSVLEFHRMITIQAARLGLLARNLRQEAAQRKNRVVTTEEARRRVQEVDCFRDRLMHLWNTTLTTFRALGHTNDCIPVRDRGIFEHVSRKLFPHLF